MRPLQLRIVGFGPFSAPATLDFQSVTDHPLFGIYGPTGSGKTTVLDAIAFALFGESSGAEREADHLRSHFVGPEVETSVELLFETGGRRYFVRRTPRQEVSKQRGEGTTEKAAEAYLFDATELEPAEIAYPDSCGEVLVERKVSEVSAMLTEIVGFKAAQFRQVVLLPQGRFRELLTASSSERSDILRRLFETEVYESFAKELKESARELTQEKSLLEERLSTILASAGVESGEELHRAIESTKGRVRDLEVERKNAGQRRDAAKGRLQEAQARMRRFEELREARGDKEALERLLPEQEEAKRRLQAAEEAAEIEPAWNRVTERGEELSRLKGREQERAGEVEVATRRAERAEAAAAQAAAREKEIERLQGEVGELARMEEEARRLSQERERHGAREAARKERASSVEKTRRSMRQKSERIEELTSKIEGLQEIDREERTLTEELSRLRRRSTLLESLAATHAAIEGKKKEESELANELRRCAEELSEATARRKAAETEESHRYRHLLASALEEGTPCPVCGSTHHPAPAEPEGQTSGRGDLPELRERERAALDARGALEKRGATITAERSALEQKAGETEEELGVLPGPGSFEAVRERLEELSRRSEELNRQIREGEGLRSEREEARAEQKELEERLGRMEAELKEVEEEAVTLRARIEEREARLPEELRGEGKVAERKRAAEATLAEERRRSEAERRELSEAAAALSKAEALRKETVERRREAEGSLKEAKQAFLGLLENSSFAGEEPFLAARMERARRREEREAVTAFENRKAAAQERLRRAEAAVGGEVAPEIERISAELREAEDALDAAVSALSEGKQELLRLEEVETRRQETATKLGEVTEAERDTASLSAMAEGRNELRTRLVDYVLSVYFDEVLTQANQRLFTMSNKRYTLHRKGASTGRGHGGLDIEVYDAFTDRRRDAATLSGGEGFLASLALALGLSDTVQEELGGLHLEVIFIDEGFGHLDEEALEEALNTLDSLTGSGRSVGIISHVEEVKRRVPAGFEVRKGVQGSALAEKRES